MLFYNMDIVLLLGILLFFTTFKVYVADKNKICYESKTCIHDSIEKCGINSEGEVRRFLDSCDILEYNCLREANYKKTSLMKCRSLSPHTDTDSKSLQQTDSNKRVRQSDSSNGLEQSDSSNSLQQSDSNNSLEQSDSSKSLQQSDSNNGTQQSDSNNSLQESDSNKSQQQSDSNYSLQQSYLKKSLQQTDSNVESLQEGSTEN